MPDRTPAKPTRVGFVSLGCPKNLVDSEVMLGALDSEGHQITADPGEADVIVVNTCGFIDSAKAESIDTILEMARFKESGSCRKLVVAGCLAERYRGEIQKEIPEIDFVLGPDELGRILEAVQTDDTQPVPNLSIDALYTSREVPTIPRLRTTPGHMAYLKISEGCDHACAFCAIPGFRGKFRSRTLEDLVCEARRLAEGGTRELILVSQDTLAYGKDLGPATCDLDRLLDALLTVEGLDWIRLLYCYPNLLADRLVDRIARDSRLCNYFDIPYQHASPSVLERMRRGGGYEIFLKQIERIRAKIPNAGLRSSFIVGFPGESDGDFNQLMEFVEAASFDHVGVFLYSDEEDTAAYDLDSKVPRKTAESRREALMTLQAGVTKRKLGALVGHRVPVLLDGVSDESDLLLEGRMETQAPEIDGKILINDAENVTPLAGRFYLAEITEALEYDLVGRLLERLQ